MRRTAHYACLILIDLFLVGGGATILWMNPGPTVTTGPFLAMLTAGAVSCGLIMTRQLLLGPINLDAESLALRHRVHQDRVIAMFDAALAVSLTAGWLITQVYIVGWLATFAVFLLLLTAGLQLLIELTIRRQPLMTTTSRSSFLAAQRLGALETMRLASTVLAIAGIVLTAGVHEWKPAIVNPLVIMLSTATVLAAILVLAVRSRQQNRRGAAIPPQTISPRTPAESTDASEAR